jgi:hypothetical protein
VKGDKLIIFGGIHEITHELNDLHIFDFNTQSWEKIFDETASPGKSPNTSFRVDPTGNDSPKNGNTQPVRFGNNMNMKPAASPVILNDLT